VPRLNFTRSVALAPSTRVKQLAGIFDVPEPGKKQVRQWQGNVPLDAEPWNVGLIVGPSGSGKTQVARELFGDAVDVPPVWHPDRANSTAASADGHFGGRPNATFEYAGPAMPDLDAARRLIFGE